MQIVSKSRGHGQKDGGLHRYRIDNSTGGTIFHYNKIRRNCHFAAIRIIEFFVSQSSTYAFYVHSFANLPVQFVVEKRKYTTVISSSVCTNACTRTHTHTHTHTHTYLISTCIGHLLNIHKRTTATHSAFRTHQAAGVTAFHLHLRENNRLWCIHQSLFQAFSIQLRRSSNRTYEVTHSGYICLIAISVYCGALQRGPIGSVAVSLLSVGLCRRLSPVCACVDKEKSQQAKNCRKKRHTHLEDHSEKAIQCS